MNGGIEVQDLLSEPISSRGAFLLPGAPLRPPLPQASARQVMKDLVHRVTDRVMRALLTPLSDRLESQHQQLVSKIEKLEKRLEAGLARGQAEARLLAVARRGPRRLGSRSASGRSITPTCARARGGTGTSTRGPGCPGRHCRSHRVQRVRSRNVDAVCEFNRFFLSETAPDADAMRADYALCHRCGVVFARRRPVGERFRFLLEHFEETLGRAAVDAQPGTKVLGSRRLSEDEADRLRARAAQPMFVSEFPRARGGVSICPSCSGIDSPSPRTSRSSARSSR